MAWIEFHTRLRDHWKIDRLKDALKIPYAHALGLVGCLWTWAAENAQNGNLSKFADSEICRATRYEGQPDGFKDILIKCELLDKNGYIHDWKAHGLKLLLSSIKRQKKYRDKLRNEKRNALRNADVSVTRELPLPYLTLPNHKTTSLPTLSSSKFVKPTAEEVTAYAQSIGYRLSGQRFCDHYETNGWVRGKTKIKDWQACVRVWKDKADPSELINQSPKVDRAKIDNAKSEADKAVSKAKDEQFDQDLKTIGNLPTLEYKEIYIEANKRMPPGRVGQRLKEASLSAFLVEVWREKNIDDNKGSLKDLVTRAVKNI